MKKLLTFILIIWSATLTAQANYTKDSRTGKEVAFFNTGVLSPLLLKISQNEKSVALLISRVETLEAQVTSLAITNQELTNTVKVQGDTINALKSSRVYFGDGFINYALALSGNVCVDSCTIVGNVSGIDTLRQSNVTGRVTFTPKSNSLALNNIISHSTLNQTPLAIAIAAGSALTNVQVIGNDISGYASGTSNYILYVCGSNQNDSNAMNRTIIRGNKIQNLYVGSGGAHTVMYGGGINLLFQYNEVTATNGHNIVMKSGNAAYTNADSFPVAYNIFRQTGVCTDVSATAISNLKFYNNTVLGLNASYLFRSTDNNGLGWTNSVDQVNNVVKLGANFSTFYDAAVTSDYNNVNLNGFTLTTPLTGTDTLITTAIDSDGVPASALYYGQVLPSPNDVGLDVSAIIPSALITKNQTTPFQRGARVL